MPKSSKCSRADGVALDAMAEACVPGECLYRWCADRSMYIKQDELLSARSSRPESVVVVDCRDEDGVGGRIRGAVRMPDSTFVADFESRLLPVLVALPRNGELLSDLSASEGAASATPRQPPMVVFHCMESVRRGPRCARRLHAYLSNLRPDDDPNQQPPRSLTIRVLEGGADHWIRRFYADSEQVEDFDDDYWGFLDGGGTSAVVCGDESGKVVGSGEDDGGQPQHRSYLRPGDQPATPWSGAGNSCKISATSKEKDLID